MSESKITVITGSSNRFAKEIYDLAKGMIEDGEYVIVDQMFHLLPEEVGRREFMKRILDADNLIVYNREGYIGYHTQLEILMAEAVGVEVKYLFGKEKSEVKENDPLEEKAI